MNDESRAVIINGSDGYVRGRCLGVLVDDVPAQVEFALLERTVRAVVYNIELICNPYLIIPPCFSSDWE